MRSSPGLNIFFLLAIALVILGNLYLLQVLWSKVIEAVQSDKGSHAKAHSYSTTTTGSTSTNGHLTSTTTKSSTGATSIRIHAKSSRISATVSEESSERSTAKKLNISSSAGIYPHQTHHHHLNRHNESDRHSHHPHRHRLDRPRRIGSEENKTPPIHQHAILRHDQHSSLEDSPLNSGQSRAPTEHTTTTERSQLHQPMPRIKVTQAELRRLYALRNLQATGNKERAVEDTAFETTATRKINPHSTTLVTALLDIGRETWPFYGRLFTKYHAFMHNVLQIRMPLVVFTDERSVAFIQTERARIGWLHLTKIWIVSVEDLPLFLYHRTMTRIMDHEQKGGGWRSEWDEAMKNHPEACNFKYDVLVNSKPYFLYNASKNPFETEFFTWLDAGYGHGKAEYFPIGYEWQPTFTQGSVSIIKVTPQWDHLSRYKLDDLYRKDVSVVSGGFLAGDKATLAKFYQQYHWKVVRLMTEHRVVDDDQTILVLLINDQPEMFKVVCGDWFDAFQLF